MRSIFSFFSHFFRDLQYSGAILSATAFLIAGGIGDAFAATGIVSFDRSPSPEVVGYKVHYGTESGRYEHTLDIGDTTECEISGLQSGCTYYFSATVYDARGNESDYSAELATSTPAADGTVPVIIDGDGDGSGDDSNEIPATDSVTVYEDAESGGTDGWMVYGADPSAGVVTNVYDETRSSRVIQLTGDGANNGYRLGDKSSAAWSSKWSNTTQFTAEWSMQYSESFTVFIDVETSDGHRYLLYTPVDYDNLGAGQNIHHGLGSAAAIGQWTHIRRDLRADLKEAQPDVTLLEVNAFLIRGSGRIDDLKLLGETASDTAPFSGTVYEDAEDETVNGWMIYGNALSEAAVTNVYDENLGSRVIQLQGAGTETGYRLADEASATWDSKWGNTTEFIAEWRMRYSESFVVFIDVETSAGHRYLLYTPVDYDNLGAGENIHHGVGSAAAGGEWVTIQRDLRADLQDAQPDVALLEVNAFLIRGSGRIDDIRLSE